jgi:TolB-like protein
MKRFFTLLAACTFLGLCISVSTPALSERLLPGVSQPQHVRGFQGIGYSIADALEHNLGQRVNKSKPILFTSFVDLDDLQMSSTFGRLLGEQVASRMAQHGYRVVELKLRRDSLIISEGAGEIVLSRNLENIRNNHDAQAVIVGTYTVVDESVIVTARLLSAVDGAMLSTHDLTLGLSPLIHSLVHKNQARVQSGRPKPSKEAATGPLGRGTVLLDPKNSLAARIIQTRLAELQYYKDKIDGIWGKNSRSALGRFKAEHQLPGTAWDLHTQQELFRGTGQ